MAMQGAFTDLRDKSLATIAEENDDDLSVLVDSINEFNEGHERLSNLTSRNSNTANQKSKSWSLENKVLVGGTVITLIISCVGLLVGLCIWIMIIMDLKFKTNTIFYIE